MYGKLVSAFESHLYATHLSYNMGMDVQLRIQLSMFILTRLDYTELAALSSLHNAPLVLDLHMHVDWRYQ